MSERCDMANQEELFSKWLVTLCCGGGSATWQVCTLYTRESSQLTYLILSGDTQQKSTQHPVGLPDPIIANGMHLTINDFQLISKPVNKSTLGNGKTWNLILFDTIHTAAEILYLHLSCQSSEGMSNKWLYVKLVKVCQTSLDMSN